MTAPPAKRSGRAAVGLADLLRSLAALEPDARMDPARWDAHARVLGLERASTPAPSKQPDVAIPGQISRSAEPADGAVRVPITPADVPPIPFWRAVEFDLRDDDRDNASAETGPALEPLTEADLRPPDDPPPFDSPPIELWSRLWPRLAAHLTTERLSRTPDTRKLVDTLARARPLQRIPRRRRRVWADRALIALDRDPSQAWLHPDQAWLVHKLRQVMGTRGLDVRLLDTGPSGLAFDPVREHHADWPRVSPGTPALAVSGFARDLATSRRSEEAPLTGRESAWRALGRRLARRGLRPAALVARPKARAVRGLSRAWSLLPWEGRTWLSDVDEAARRQRVHRLLALAAPALVVPAALLRSLRALLHGEGADVGTEADAWAHPDLEPTAYGLRFLPERAHAWLERFAALPGELQERAWPLIWRYQRRYGREANALSTWRLMGVATGRVVSDSQRDEAIRIARRLGLASEHARPDPLQTGLMRWFRQFEPLVSKAMFEDEDIGQGLARMWFECHAEHDMAPEGIDPWQRPPPPEGEAREQTLVHRKGGLWLSGPGSPVATLPMRGGLVAYNRRRIPLDADRAIVAPGARGGELRSERARVRLEPFIRPPWARDIGRDAHGLWVACDIAGEMVRMRWIPPGRFVMGSPDDEPGRFTDEGPQHEVILTRGLWLAETPCTQALWTAVMGDNPSEFQSAERPVENVTVAMVESFLDRLNQHQTRGGPGFRLPTEAEWEYACRAGTVEATYAGRIQLEGENAAPVLDAIAWYGGNSGVDFELDSGWDSSGWPEKQHEHERAGTHPVARKGCNPWGLYDMLGNVYEWCADSMRSYSNERVRNPYEPPAALADRVVRGGSWFGFARLVRAAFRRAYLPGDALVVVGFRLARGQEAAQPEPAERA